MNGPELKAWRKLLGLTQEEAAAEFGVTRPTIQNWEYGITSVPLSVDLASRQLLRRWKQRPEFGPVTLVYASAPLSPVLNASDRPPTLFCRQCSDNNAAFHEVFELRNSSDVFNPLILDETNCVIWSGPKLLEQYERLQAKVGAAT